MSNEEAGKDATEELIKESFNKIERTLFFIDGVLNYQSTTEELIKLCQLIHRYCNKWDSESLWYIEEGGCCCLVDLVVGAYWFYYDYHGGLSSIEYTALSQLGTIYNPNMETLEFGSIEKDVYDELENLYNEDN